MHIHYRPNGNRMVGLGAGCACSLIVIKFSCLFYVVDITAYRLGPLELATQSVLLVSASTTFQAPFALGVATSVRCVAYWVLRSCYLRCYMPVLEICWERERLYAPKFLQTQRL